MSDLTPGTYRVNDDLPEDVRAFCADLDILPGDFIVLFEGPTGEMQGMLYRKGGDEPGRRGQLRLLR